MLMSDKEELFESIVPRIVDNSFAGKILFEY